MSRVFRISKRPDVGDVVDLLEALAVFARAHGEGRYKVDEHFAEPFEGTKVTARAWGKVLHHRDGAVVLDPIF